MAAFLFSGGARAKVLRAKIRSAGCGFKNDEQTIRHHFGASLCSTPRAQLASAPADFVS